MTLDDFLTLTATRLPTAPELVALCDVKGAAAAVEGWPAGDPATPRQLGWFRYKGVRDVERHGLTKWRASTVRDLVEAGVSMDTALGYGKRQALAVLRSVREKAGTT